MVRRISSPVFVGRVQELALLDAALDAAEQGEPGIILVGGDAGIGKTRFATEFAATVESRHGQVARGQSFPGSAETMPFAPFIQIVRRLLATEAADAPSRTPPASDPALTPLVRGSGPRSTGDPAPSTQIDRFAMFQAVLDLVDRASRDRPLAVLIEDLHWADESSLDLLAFVAGQLGSQRLVMLGTFRSDELTRAHPLISRLGELVRLAHTARIDLQGFNREEVEDQLTGILGRRPSTSMLDAALMRSDGNPFHVEELAREGPEGRMSTTLREALQARLARLSPSARRVVFAVAAIGRVATQELIEAVIDDRPEELGGALGEALEHSILVQADDGTGYAFRHALVQEAAADGLLPSERVVLHRKIVAALQAGGGASGEIARHAMLAHDAPTALAWSVKAADDAVAVVAFSEALAHVDRALELWPAVAAADRVAGRDLGSMLVLASDCAGALGLWARAADLGRAAVATLDPVERPEARASALLDLAHWAMMADQETDRAAAIHEAAALVPDVPPSALRARVLIELAHLLDHNGQAAGAQILAEEAAAMSRRVGAADEEATALLGLGVILVDLLRPQAAAAVLAEAADIAASPRGRPSDLAGRIQFRRSEVAVDSGFFEMAIELVDDALVVAARSGRSGQITGNLRQVKIQALMALGRWPEAEVLVDEARRADVEPATRIAVRSFVECLVRQGRLVDAAAAVRLTDYDVVTPHEAVMQRLATIRLAHAEGRWDDARSAADEVMALFPVDERNFDALTILAMSVGIEADRAAIERSRRRRAHLADARRVGGGRLDIIRRWAEPAMEAGGAGSVIELILATAEAEGSRLAADSDPDRWLAVADQARTLTLPWETSYASFRMAEAVLAGRGAREHAATSLGAAHRIAVGLGARPLVEQIDRLARRGRINLGIDPINRSVRRATTPEGVLVRLTSREWEVLSLVASGHTNREIGAALFISNKTVSVHISNAMDKLGALSRFDAASRATQLGLLETGARGNGI